jgi:hypothetical protein
VKSELLRVRTKLNRKTTDTNKPSLTIKNLQYRRDLAKNKIEINKLKEDLKVNQESGGKVPKYE